MVVTNGNGVMAGKKKQSGNTATSNGKRSSASDDLQSVLTNAVGQIEKAFGRGAIMRLDEDSSTGIPGIPTGALSLDLALGGRGIPQGRIIEVFGPESSGKTTLALHTVANAQKAGGIAAFIDAEHALDPSWAKRIGVNLEELLVSQPSYGEEALQIAEMLIKSNAVDVIVIDSVAALVPKTELDGEIGDTHVGLQARMMSQAMRKLTGAIARSKTCVIFINQIREKVGVMFGSPETTPGGRALKFYSSVRLDVRRITTLKEGDQTIGMRMKVKVVKNKIAPPFRVAEFDMLSTRGISYEGDVLDMAVADHIVQKSGSWFSYDGNRLGQGREKARAYFEENPDTLEEVRLKVLEARGVTLPATTTVDADGEVLEEE
ncbi:recombinase RecA [Calycomorphotria hydatis]|uniref:Protein RecA n=1 Tax=Calycomorphotria hydatis TaxID=2528027 RepID=A0A517TCK0_9PLAN|nr:recombinase RecA [Calycomorphotria hydatis]QDT66099.1 Protein RecA [Calycomorphotria hydatis]